MDKWQVADDEVKAARAEIYSALLRAEHSVDEECVALLERALARMREAHEIYYADDIRRKRWFEANKEALDAATANGCVLVVDADGNIVDTVKMRQDG